MINRAITNDDLQKILCLLRLGIINHTKNASDALYAPLNGGKNQSNFPLHCDLYVPKILWNIFGQVPADGSGRTLLLPVGVFLAMLREIKTIPRRIIDEIASLISSDDATDHFDRLYYLLYHEQQPWHRAILLKTNATQYSILLRRGEGYMINDRIWMHGRGHTNGYYKEKITSFNFQCMRRPEAFLTVCKTRKRRLDQLVFWGNKCFFTFKEQCL